MLVDQVGLGKTVQLALAAMLMAMTSKKPVLVLAPKPLLLQWQDELMELIDMPSAIWTGKNWIDELGIVWPSTGGRKHCTMSKRFRFGVTRINNFGFNCRRLFIEYAI